MTPDPDHWESTCERDPCAASVFFLRIDHRIILEF